MKNRLAVAVLVCLLAPWASVMGQTPAAVDAAGYAKEIVASHGGADKLLRT
jgi:hypothetical protein